MNTDEVRNHDRRFSGDLSRYATDVTVSDAVIERPRRADQVGEDITARSGN